MENLNLGVRRRAQRYVAHPVARNLVSLYSLQFAGYAIPMLTLPYLARVLRPQGFGLLLFAQSFALWSSMLIEYGFNYSATRDVARLRDDPAALARIAAGVLGAKLILLASITVMSVAAAMFVPVFRAHPAYLLCALPQILAGGFSPFWYFQGTERMVPAVSIELTSRLVFTGLIFALVRNAGDGWKALLLQGCGSACATIFPTLLMVRAIGFVAPSWADSRKVLREGWSMFLFRSSYTIFTGTNAFILGIMASPIQVGLYGGGERIARAVQGQIDPITQAFYPRISHLFAHSEVDARKMARLVIGASGVAGLLLAAGLAILARPLTHLLLGPGYDGSVTVVRLFALLLPISSLSNAIITHWMLPLKMDRTASSVIQVAIAINLVAAVLLEPRLAHVGMALAVLAAEATMLVSLAAVLMRDAAALRTSSNIAPQPPVELT
jgi:polysaccharide transporter, PST family